MIRPEFEILVVADVITASGGGEEISNTGEWDWG